MTVQSASNPATVSAWRTPLVIIVCGCLIGAIGFGPRAALGLFLTPMSSAYGWGRDVFALALAIQVLIWGAATPFAGAIADRYGSLRVLSAGAVLYFVGLVLMAAFDHARHARSIRWSSHRTGYCRDVVHACACLLQQIDAARVARLRIWHRNSRGLVWTIPFLSLAVALIGHLGWQDALIALGVFTSKYLPQKSGFRFVHDLESASDAISEIISDWPLVSRQSRGVSRSNSLIRKGICAKSSTLHRGRPDFGEALNRRLQNNFRVLLVWPIWRI